MIVIENGDLIEGDSTSASEVDFVISGLDNNALTQLADGQLANSKGTLYTANSTDVVSSIILVNTGASHNHVNLYVKPSGGTSRRLIAKDLQLESGYSLHFDGAKVMVLNTGGQIIYVGATGASGTSGTSGTSGSSGSSGSSGTSGTSGSSGTHGTSGTSGSSGSTGTHGTSGTSGSGTSGTSGTGAGGGIVWTLIAGTSGTGTANCGYIWGTGGTNGTFVLPPTPVTGDYVSVVDGAGNFGTFNLVIGRGTANIMRLGENMTANYNYARAGFVYGDATNGWRVV